jgi:hypothetical protein
VRLPFVWLKLITLWIAVAALPVAIADIFFKARGARIALATVGFLLFLSAIRAERTLRKTLRPSRMKIGPYRVLAIEDPSSHAFATHGLFAAEPSLWITRGALSLLTPDEILNLMSGMRAAARQGSLRFETVITAWLIKLTANVPSGFREILFFRQKRTKTILIRESARGVFWVSLVLLLESFYFARRKGLPPIAEEVLRKLEAESRRCVPRLPAALSSHSAVSPWPDAFLTLGRPCLLPERAVNLRDDFGRRNLG